VNIVSLIKNYDCSVVEPDTKNGTRRLLERWIAKTPTERAAMAEGSIRCYKERFNLEENKSTILRLFEKALAGPFNRRRLSR
jgi:hypothetical protein